MRKCRKGIIFAVLIIAALIACFFLMINSTSPRIVTRATAEIKTRSNIAVNESVFYTLKDFGYNDFVSIQKDSQGKIVSITSNTMLLNTLARILVDGVQKKVAGIAENGVDIPLGSLSGWTLLTGKGPDINIGVRPYQDVTCKFVSEFESAGINQTRHKIVLVVEANFTIVLPTATTTVANTVEVLVAESIIVGEVPQIYFNTGRNN